jgi:hypothetical protein
VVCCVCVMVGVQPNLFYGRLLACPMQLRQGWLQGGNAPLEALRTQADLRLRVEATPIYSTMRPALPHHASG